MPGTGREDDDERERREREKNILVVWDLYSSIACRLALLPAPDGQKGHDD